MQTMGFTGCCTASVIVGLGQTSTAEYRGERLSVAEMRVQLASRCRVAKDHGHAIVTVITNSEQTDANKALLAEGWKHSKWCTKSQHRDTQIRLWHKCLMDLEN